MRKFVLCCMLLIMCSAVSLSYSEPVLAETVLSREEALRTRFAWKREKLAEIVAKKRERIEQSILTRLEEQEKIREEKKKAAIGAEQPVDNSEPSSVAAESNVVAEAPVNETEAANAAPEPEAVTSATVVTGPSQVVTGATQVVTGASRR